MDLPSRAAMLDLARTLRLRTGQLVTALDTLDEIAVRERVTVAAILDRVEIRRIANGSGLGAIARERAVGSIANPSVPSPQKNAGAAPL